MKDFRHLEWLYSYRGAKLADRYCDAQRLIGSVCMSCKKIYRLVDSQRDGGGLSHGWCSEACASVEEQRMTKPDHRSDPPRTWATEVSESLPKSR